MKTSAITMAAALLAGSAMASNDTTATTSTTSAGCWEVSVEHDATYCIEGPICSGSGLEPAGSLCPVQGDAATADCHDYLASYAGEGSCVLPVDATCQVIKTGAWGCVLSSSSTSRSSTSGSGEGTAEAGSGSAANATVLASEGAASAGSVSAGVVGAIAAAAAAVAAVAGFALYKQHQKHTAEAEELRRMETFVDVVTP